MARDPVASQCTLDRQWYSEKNVPAYENPKLVAPIQDQKVLGQNSIYRQR